MILLGVMSQYTWLDFVTFIVIVDGIILAFGFALDKFVWSTDSALTKNEQRSQREEDREVGHRNYKKLSETAYDYNEVVSVDGDFNDDESISPGWDGMPSSSEIAGGMDEDEEYDLPSRSDPDEDDEGYSPPSDSDEIDEMRENNRRAQEVFFCDSEDGEVFTGDDFDSTVRNMEFLDDEDEERVYASTHQDEILTGVRIKQGDGEFSEVDDARGVVIGNELPEDFPELAAPKNLSDEMQDPDEGPSFDNE